jgi:hypothetical protein
MKLCISNTYDLILFPKKYYNIEDLQWTFNQCKKIFHADDVII